MSSTSRLPWWISPLQSSDWTAPRKFILEDSSVLFCLLMILLEGILSPGQLIISALTLAIDLSFPLGSLKVNQNNKLSLNLSLKLSLNQKLSSTKKKTQLWNEST